MIERSSLRRRLLHTAPFRGNAQYSKRAQQVAPRNLAAVIQGQQLIDLIHSKLLYENAVKPSRSNRGPSKSEDVEALRRIRNN